MKNKLVAKTTGVKNAVVKLGHRAGLKISKYSPEILAGVGVVAIVGGVVLACRATLKAEEVLEDHEEEMDLIRQATQRVDDYSDADRQRDTALVYIHTVGKFAKIYAPAVGLLTLGIGCMLGSYGILKKRNVALMAAYEGLQKTLLEYRERVRNELGEEKEERLYRGVVAEDKVNDEGEKLPTLPSGYVPSVYARFFDEFNPQWCKNSELNKLNLLKLQDWANNMLHAQGHLFLNEVYDMLDIPRSSAGAVVGWVEGNGDSYVDFGIFNVNREKCRDFVNGYERSILLDFNVDGVIYDLI